MSSYLSLGALLRSKDKLRIKYDALKLANRNITSALDSLKSQQSFSALNSPLNSSVSVGTDIESETSDICYEDTLQALQAEVSGLQERRAYLQTQTKHLQELENMLVAFAQCNVCSGFIGKPALLTCGHLFCADCLIATRDAANLPDMKTPCPDCGEHARIRASKAFVFRDLFDFVKDNWW